MSVQPDVISVEQLVEMTRLVLPCDWQLLGGRNPAPQGPWVLPECAEPAAWVVSWRAFCARDGVVPARFAGRPSLVCEAHFRELLGQGLIPLWCSACGSPVADATHFLSSWKRI